MCERESESERASERGEAAFAELTEARLMPRSFIYSACGAALMSGYIIYDTDAIMKRMGPDDWPIACVEARGTEGVCLWGYVCLSVSMPVSVSGLLPAWR